MASTPCHASVWYGTHQRTFGDNSNRSIEAIALSVVCIEVYGPKITCKSSFQSKIMVADNTTMVVLHLSKIQKVALTALLACSVVQMAYGIFKTNLMTHATEPTCHHRPDQENRRLGAHMRESEGQEHGMRVAEALLGGVYLM